MIPGDRASEAIWGRSSIRDGSPNNNDQSYEQTLTSATPSASDLPNLVEETPVAIDIFNFTTKKIIDQRRGSSGIEYKCEFEPLWLAADLVGKAKRGRVHIRRHENRLLREGRRKTLRQGKRKLSER